MFRCCASPPSEVVVHNVVTFTQVQTVKYKDYTCVRACTRQAHDLHKRLSVCSAKSHTSQLNLPGLQNIGGPTDQVCVRQEKSVEVQSAVGMQICCASQQELRSTERNTSTRFTQTFGRVHRTKAGEGPYGSSGISSLDRYYHR